MRSTKSLYSLLKKVLDDNQILPTLVSQLSDVQGEFLLTVEPFQSSENIYKPPLCQAGQANSSSTVDPTVSLP